jgi:hypothetical protein
MRVTEEMKEAAARRMHLAEQLAGRDHSLGDCRVLAGIALEAALALPQPTVADEERAREIAEWFHGDLSIDDDKLAPQITRALAAVRAEYEGLLREVQPLLAEARPYLYAAAHGDHGATTGLEVRVAAVLRAPAKEPT